MDRDQEIITLVNNSAQPKKSFAELLEAYTPEPLYRGQYVAGEILQIDGNVILADVDAKRTAVVPPQDLAKLEEEELEELSVGDEVTLYVLRTPRGDDDLLVSLNKGLEYQDWQEAETYLANDEQLELEVVGHNKGGLLVDFNRLQGFIPTSHVPQLQNIYNQHQLISRKAKLVGQELPLKVLEVDYESERFVLSAKEATKERRQKRLCELQEQIGQVVTGRVSNLVKFGAFVDLDGVDGLIHISEIAWQKIDKPSDVLALGDEVEVLIESVDIARERVGLSRKVLLPSPWTQFAQTHAAGDLIEGFVVNTVDFGAFVLVADGIEGLIHVSEMRGNRDTSPHDLLSSGDTVLVRLLDIDVDRERISLSQRRISQQEEMEWIWQREQAAQGGETV